MGFIVLGLEGRWLHVVMLATGETILRAEEGMPRREAVLERVDLAHGRVALRAADGRYLARHLTHPHDGAALIGAALHLVEELTACAAFEELQLPDGTVSLRGCDLRFLGVSPSSGAVVADRVADGSWERFRYVEVPATSTAPSPLVPAQGGGPAASAAPAPAAPAPAAPAPFGTADRPPSSTVGDGAWLRWGATGSVAVQGPR